MATHEVKSGGATYRWAICALLVAVCGTVGSVYLSVGMGLKACPLCFYQRTFVMSAMAVLVVGLVRDRTQAGLLSLVCLPLAVGGLGVAAFHEYLEYSGKLECPQAILGLGTAPQQSLALFVLLTVVLAITARRQVAAAGLAVLLGLGLAWACIASAPPMPPAPTKPYEQPLDICRPPFVAAVQ
jgi:disulfide bond formation protein DsbB